MLNVISNMKCPILCTISNKLILPIQCIKCQPTFRYACRNFDFEQLPTWHSNPESLSILESCWRNVGLNPTSWLKFHLLKSADVWSWVSNFFSHFKLNLQPGALGSKRETPRVAAALRQAPRGPTKLQKASMRPHEPRRALMRPHKAREIAGSPIEPRRGPTSCDKAPRSPTKLQESLSSPDEDQRNSHYLRQSSPSISNISRPPTRPRERETSPEPSPNINDLPRAKFCNFNNFLVNFLFFSIRLQVLLFFRFTASCRGLGHTICDILRHLWHLGHYMWYV